MKTPLLLLVLFFGAVSFGQSAKKLNQQLRTELALEQQKHDSLRVIFLAADTRFHHLKTQTEEKIGQLSLKSDAVKLQGKDFFATVKKLKKLDQHPDLSELEPFKNLLQPRDFKSSVQELSLKIKSYEAFSNGDYPNLEELKRKDQNETMTLQINEYKKLLPSNELRLQQNEQVKQELEQLTARLDSTSSVYDQAYEVLVSEKNKVNEQLNTLREAYRLKGPKGFSDAYRNVFPEIHPLPKEKLKDDQPFSRGTYLEQSSSMNEGDAVPPPPPVEAPRTDRQEPEIYVVVEELAEFPGGMAALRKYLSENLRYPQTAIEHEIQGKVYLKFVISEEGKISNIVVLRGISDCPECSEEAIRLVKGMPNWIAAKNNGKSVKSYFNLPLTFKLN